MTFQPTIFNFLYPTWPISNSNKSFDLTQYSLKWKFGRNGWVVKKLNKQGRQFPSATGILSVYFLYISGFEYLFKS